MNLLSEESIKKRIPEIIKMYISTIASNPDSLTSIANQISENYESGIQMIKTKLLNEILTKKIKRKMLN